MLTRGRKFPGKTLTTDQFGLYGKTLCRVGLVYSFLQFQPQCRGVRVDSPEFSEQKRKGQRCLPTFGFKTPLICIENGVEVVCTLFRVQTTSFVWTKG